MRFVQMASGVLALKRLWEKFPATQKGILCIVATTLCFSSMDTMAKLLSARYDPFYIVWARYSSQAVLTFLVFLPQLGVLLRANRPGLQILRSAFLFAATCLFFSGLAIMPMIDVIAVAQVVPLLITGLAALVLSERVGPYRWLGVVAGLIGAMVILRPGFGGVGIASLLPLTAAFVFACYSIATRFLGNEDSVWTTFIFTGMFGAIGASIAVPFFWEVPDIADVPAMVLMGIFGAAGQLALIFAFSYAAASLLAPFLYISMVWAALLGFFVFAEVPDIWTITGAFMIICAGLYVRHRELKRDAVR